jgi:hypothetical protein
VVYFSYFHSIIKYGIVFWGNSTNDSRVFKLQKRVITCGEIIHLNRVLRYSIFGPFAAGNKFVTFFD